ncbi:MAG: hypothetical protein ACTSO4_16415 [Promethearchaeota archaeon]
MMKFRKIRVISIVEMNYVIISNVEKLMLKILYYFTVFFEQIITRNDLRYFNKLREELEE